MPNTIGDLQAAAAQIEDLLTPHQLRIVAMARGGLTTVQIAAALHKTPTTVAYHRMAIRAKLGGVGWQIAELLHEAAGLPAEGPAD
jgi:DNA-binding CsgD family transcriptional regulator